MRERRRERLLEALAGLGAAQGWQRAMPPDPCPGRGDSPPPPHRGKVWVSPTSRTEGLAGPTPGTGSASPAAAMEITGISRAGSRKVLERWGAPEDPTPSLSAWPGLSLQRGRAPGSLPPQAHGHFPPHLQQEH